MGESVQCLNCIRHDTYFTLENSNTIFKKLWQIVCWGFPDTFQYLLKNINRFPLLQKINFRLPTTVNKYGIISKGMNDQLYHRLKWNKNKMRCACLIYWKFKQIFGRDVAKYVCDFILYGLAFPEDGWECTAKYKVVLKQNEIIQINVIEKELDKIDIELYTAQILRAILGKKRTRYVLNMTKKYEKEMRELEVKKRKLAKKFYFK